MPTFTFERATESDRTYLRRLNFLADVYGDETKEVGPDQLADVARYVDAWDPERDGGVIAFDEYRTPAGGTWLRYWETPTDGYANIAPNVPELAIAVENRFAGNRLAARLLEAVAELAREQGAPQLALWVDPNNPRARHRYEVFGFRDYPDAENVMVLDI